MARNVEGGAQGEIVEFIPESFENKDDESPVLVKYREPTEGERRRLVAKAQAEIDGDNVERALAFQSSILSERVSDVVNYSVRGKDIKSGDDLAEFGESEIVAEVFGAIMYANKLSEDEAKN